MNDIKQSVLNKFKKTKEGGKAARTRDEQFGFPETYLVTLTNVEREYVLQALAEYRGK